VEKQGKGGEATAEGGGGKYGNIGRRGNKCPSGVLNEEREPQMH
jgi:hypothetical protein